MASPNAPAGSSKGSWAALAAKGTAASAAASEQVASSHVAATAGSATPVSPTADEESAQSHYAIAAPDGLALSTHDVLVSLLVAMRGEVVTVWVRSLAVSLAFFSAACLVAKVSTHCVLRSASRVFLTIAALVFALCSTSTEPSTTVSFARRGLRRPRMRTRTRSTRSASKWRSDAAPTACATSIRTSSKL